MIAQVLQRMNRREQVLAGLVAMVVFFLANLFLWSWLFRAIGDSRVEVGKRKQAHKQQTVLLRESDLWSKREQWLREHQPVFHGASDASALLDQLKQIAGKYSVLIENPAIGDSPAAGAFQTVFCSIETKSPSAPLGYFLFGLQAPAAFLFFERSTTSIDSCYPTPTRGKFKIV